MSDPRYTVLVVDDDPDARMIMRLALRKAGFGVRVAGSGEEALRQFREQPSDLVMLDVEMPGLGGHEVCATLRAEAGPLLPIVMVTGMDDLRSVETAYERGATDFISKPVNWALFGHRVRYLFRSHQAMLDLRAAESRAWRLAYFDPLTGLPNRHAFLERVDGELRSADRPPTRLAVLVMDLDGFKNINDTNGHAAGDQVLQWAAERLRHCLRRTADTATRTIAHEDDARGGDDLARLGGDEFTVLVRDIQRPQDALVVAQRIGQAMRRPFVVDGVEVTLTSSIGIALYPQDGQDGATLLKHAETAMYHAKGSGRDNTQVYCSALTEEIRLRMTLDANLRTALDRNEFHLVYQPQVDVGSGEVRSVEALLRWTHPERGPIPPMAFIPLAEQNGLIDRIGQWVLRTACEDAVRWRDAGLAVNVAVNLSPVQFRHADLARSVIGTLADTGLAPDALELEVTEGALMENCDATRVALQALSAHGVRIALDDFGTGYSSLAYLTRMPIGNIKVDKCFVAGLLDGGENEAIVRAVLAMAHSLGMRVTAEGVETQAQAQALHALACDALQGYYFSRPVPAGEIPALLSRRWPEVVAPG